MDRGADNWQLSFLVGAVLFVAFTAWHGWRLDSVSRFAYRRARRILPAYWAALAFSLAVAWLVVAPPGEGTPNAESVVVNGLLAQNLIGAPSPNRAFWSMAVEAQLYVVLPLLLLMVRRWGAIAMVWPKPL